MFIAQLIKLQLIGGTEGSVSDENRKIEKMIALNGTPRKVSLQRFSTRVRVSESNLTNSLVLYFTFKISYINLVSYVEFF